MAMASLEQPATHVGFISKEEAAAELGISARRVLEFAQAGALQSERQRNPETNLWQVKIHAGDVERLRRERSEPRPRISRAKIAIAASPALLPQIAAPPASRPFDGFPVSVWLTVEEAATFVRLPAAFIAARIRTGALPALDVGVRAGGRYRVKRSDLDALEAAAISQPHVQGEAEFGSR